MTVEAATCSASPTTSWWGDEPPYPLTSEVAPVTAASTAASPSDEPTDQEAGRGLASTLSHLATPAMGAALGAAAVGTWLGGASITAACLSTPISTLLCAGAAVLGGSAGEAAAQAADGTPPSKLDYRAIGHAGMSATVGLASGPVLYATKVAPLGFGTQRVLMSVATGTVAGRLTAAASSNSNTPIADAFTDRQGWMTDVVFSIGGAALSERMLVRGMSDATTRSLLATRVAQSLGLDEPQGAAAARKVEQYLAKKGFDLSKADIVDVQWHLSTPDLQEFLDGLDASAGPVRAWLDKNPTVRAALAHMGSIERGTDNLGSMIPAEIPRSLRAGEVIDPVDMTRRELVEHRALIADALETLEVELSAVQEAEVTKAVLADAKRIRHQLIEHLEGLDRLLDIGQHAD